MQNVVTLALQGRDGSNGGPGPKVRHSNVNYIQPNVLGPLSWLRTTLELMTQVKRVRQLSTRLPSGYSGSLPTGNVDRVCWN